MSSTPRRNCPRLEFEAVRGEVGGIKEAAVDLDGTTLKVAVVNGLKNAEEIIRDAFHVEPEGNIAKLPGVVSRKKQLIPPLLAALQARQ